jgi:hypothetical protein
MAKTAFHNHSMLTWQLQPRRAPLLLLLQAPTQPAADPPSPTSVDPAALHLLHHQLQGVVPEQLTLGAQVSLVLTAAGRWLPEGQGWPADRPAAAQHHAAAGLAVGGTGAPGPSGLQQYQQHTARGVKRGLCIITKLKKGAKLGTRMHALSSCTPVLWCCSDASTHTNGPVLCPWHP